MTTTRPERAHPIRDAWRRVAPDDATERAALALTAVSAGLFAAIAWAVERGLTQGIDERLLVLLRHPADLGDPLGPPWLPETARDLTALGSAAVLVLVIAVVAGDLAIRGAYHTMALVLAASTGGLVLGGLLKRAFERPRPEVVPHLAPARFSSFPSGHSLNAAVVYLTLGLMIAGLAKGRRMAAYAVGVAVTLTLVVGLTRVYIGVHYPSDVLGGWAAGSTWAGLCSLAARRLRRSGAVEAVD